MFGNDVEGGRKSDLWIRFKKKRERHTDPFCWGTETTRQQVITTATASVLSGDVNGL